VLPERLRSERKKRKLTQEEMADRLGIARSTYSGYETGKTEPDFDTLEKIANYLEVSYDYLLGRTNDPTPKEKDAADKLKDYLDFELTDEQIIERLNFKVDNITLTDEEVMQVIAFIRTVRSMKSEQAAASRLQEP
jgi:transcriptional regulator with XRE-family HTH domain